MLSGTFAFVAATDAMFEVAMSDVNYESVGKDSNPDTESAEAEGQSTFECPALMIRPGNSNDLLHESSSCWKPGGAPEADESSSDRD